MTEHTVTAGFRETDLQVYILRQRLLRSHRAEIRPDGVHPSLGSRRLRTRSSATPISVHQIYRHICDVNCPLQGRSVNT